MQNFYMIIGFLETFLLHEGVASGDTRIGVIGYSTQATVEFYLNSYNTIAALYAGIHSIKYLRNGRRTNTAAAIRLARATMFSKEHGDRSDAENKLILITDGVSDINKVDTLPEAQLTREAGIAIYAIGLALRKTDELQGIASLPLQDHLFLADDFSQFYDLQQTIYESSSCPEDVVSPPSGSMSHAPNIPSTQKSTKCQTINVRY